MVTQNDLKIISHLRNNARFKVTDISKSVGIPATTIYDKIRSQERRGILRKHTSLIDFTKLGYSSNMLIAITVPKDCRENLKNYLQSHPNINSLFRVDGEFDFLLETVFEDQSCLQEFMDYIDMNYNASRKLSVNLAQEIKRESFLGDIALLDECT